MPVLLFFLYFFLHLLTIFVRYSKTVISCHVHKNPHNRSGSVFYQFFFFCLFLFFFFSYSLDWSFGHFILVQSRFCKFNLCLCSYVTLYLFTILRLLWRLLTFSFFCYPIYPIFYSFLCLLRCLPDISASVSCNHFILNLRGKKREEMNNEHQVLWVMEKIESNENKNKRMHV